VKSEAEVTVDVRLALSKRGVRCWRNNCGAVTTDDNRHIRFGLGNESASLNKQIKSSDIIGITPVVITQEMVGTTVGVFTSYELKHEGWRYTGSGRQAAQNAWLNLVQSLGGIARFITAVQDLP